MIRAKYLNQMPFVANLRFIYGWIQRRPLKRKVLSALCNFEFTSLLTHVLNSDLPHRCIWEFEWFSTRWCPFSAITRTWKGVKPTAEIFVNLVPNLAWCALSWGVALVNEPTIMVWFCFASDGAVSSAQRRREVGVENERSLACTYAATTIWFCSKLARRTFYRFHKGANHDDGLNGWIANLGGWPKLRSFKPLGSETWAVRWWTRWRT